MYISQLVLTENYIPISNQNYSTSIGWWHRIIILTPSHIIIIPGSSPNYNYKVGGISTAIKLKSI